MNRMPLTMPNVQPPTQQELLRLGDYNDQSARAAANNTLPDWVFDHYANDLSTAFDSVAGAVLGTDAPSSASNVSLSGDLSFGEYFDPEAVKDDNNAETIWKDNDFRAWLQSQAEYNDARTRSMTDYNYDKMREFRSTAYQDTVADLRAAGLNPVLAYSNGANSSSNGYSSAAAVNGTGANSQLDHNTIKDMMSAYLSLLGVTVNSAGDVLSALIRRK